MMDSSKFRDFTGTERLRGISLRELFSDVFRKHGVADVERQLFIVSVVLHMIWNLNVELPFLGKYLCLGFVAWMVVLSLIQEGLGELRLEKGYASAEKDC